MNIKMSPKDFFLHLGVMVTLYVSSISIITLLFQVINVAYPDALANVYAYSSYDPYSASIRWAIASIVIVFPLYIFLSWLVNRDYKAVPEKLTLGIRKTLIYITLFLAGIAIVTDLIVLLNSFLGGEITTRFILKVVALLAVTGFVFGHYLWDLRRQPGAMMDNKPKLFAIIASVLVLAVLVWGFLVMGSPTKQRNIQFDQTKTNDLQNIQSSVVNYWQAKGSLPNQISDLNNSLDYYNYGSLNDPQTQQPYEYRKTGDTSFELCANFNVSSSESGVTSPAKFVPGEYQNINNGFSNWDHAAGRVCFSRTIDPKLYPVRKSQE